MWVGSLLAVGLLAACGSGAPWPDQGQAGGAAGSPGGTSVCGACTSDQECQTNCHSATGGLYCCDLASSVGGSALCYLSGSTMCPGSTSGGSSSGGNARSDAGRPPGGGLNLVRDGGRG
jgi:hypothetical protein